MPLHWNDTLATGVRQIDLQHQELIEILNELEAAHAAGHAAEALDEVLPRLEAYVLFHFATEEGLAAAHDPDHVAAHRREHAGFAARVAELRAGPLAAADLPALIDYLKRWLVEHIMKTDRALGARILDGIK